MEAIYISIALLGLIGITTLAIIYNFKIMKLDRKIDVLKDLLDNSSEVIDYKDILDKID